MWFNQYIICRLQMWSISNDRNELLTVYSHWTVMEEGERWRFILVHINLFTFQLYLNTNILKTTCHVKWQSKSSTGATQNQSKSCDLTLVSASCEFMSFENIPVTFLGQKSLSSHILHWIHHMPSAQLPKYNQILTIFLLLLCCSTRFSSGLLLQALVSPISICCCLLKNLLNSGARMISLKCEAISGVSLLKFCSSFFI